MQEKVFIFVHMKKFKKYQKVKIAKENFICVCVDDEIAIFAPFDGTRTKFRNMITVSPRYKKTKDGGDADGFVFKNYVLK